MNGVWRWFFKPTCLAEFAHYYGSVQILYYYILSYIIILLYIIICIYFDLFKLSGAMDVMGISRPRNPRNYENAWN